MTDRYVSHSTDVQTLIRFIAIANRTGIFVSEGVLLSRHHSRGEKAYKFSVYTVNTLF